MYSLILGEKTYRVSKDDKKTKNKEIEIDRN